MFEKKVDEIRSRLMERRNDGGPGSGNFGHGGRPGERGGSSSGGSSSSGNGQSKFSIPKQTISDLNLKKSETYKGTDVYKNERRGTYWIASPANGRVKSFSSELAAHSFIDAHSSDKSSVSNTAAVSSDPSLSKFYDRLSETYDNPTRMADKLPELLNEELSHPEKYGNWLMTGGHYTPHGVELLEAMKDDPGQLTQTAFNKNYGACLLEAQILKNHGYEKEASRSINGAKEAMKLFKDYSVRVGPNDGESYVKKGIVGYTGH